MRKVLSGVGSVAMIPVRGLSVLVARCVYPVSLVGLIGGSGMGVTFALRGAWPSVATAAVLVIFTAGLFLASRAVLRAWSQPDTRPRVRYIYRDQIY